MENYSQTLPEQEVVSAIPSDFQILSNELSMESVASKINVDVAKVLPITVQKQEQSNWCWIACSVSVHNYFNPAQPGSQCQLASMMMNQPCCANPGPCNVPGSPSNALQLMNNLSRVLAINNLSFPDVQTEINYGNPIILGYTPGSVQQGHAIVLCGYDKSNGNVYVLDPETGPAVGPFSSIIFAYSKYPSQVCFTKR